MWPKTGAAVTLAALLLMGAGCAQPPSVAPKPPPSAQEIAARRAADAAALERAAQEVRVAAAVEIADAAYLYAYPLITSDIVRRQMAGVGKGDDRRAPLNSFWHQRQGQDQGAFAEPDTLASIAWLDLEHDPVLFTLPAMGKRSFSFTLHSLWMPALASVGSDGAGKATRWLISGPDWQGQVPKGVRLVRSPTRHAVIIGRIQADGDAVDQRRVERLQSRLRLAPQAARGKGHRIAAPASEPAIALDATPRQIIEAMDIAAYFARLAQLLGSSAPAPQADAAWLQKMAQLGIEPGRPFDADALEPAVREGLLDTGRRMRAKIDGAWPGLHIAVNGWQVPVVFADEHSDALQRAAIAAFDWPGQVPQQRLELVARVDADGNPLTGAHDYLLRFDKGQLPPVDGFWTLGMNPGADGAGTPVRNTYDRISLGSGDALKPDDDGALRLRVQNLSPGYDRASHWLPAPKGEFRLTLRLYAPRTASPSLLPPSRGDWAPPALRRSD